MRPKVLVMTSVHWPDDTRIRERLIRTLATEFEITYAARAPGPSDRSGIDYRQLRGGRVRRNLEALWVGLTARYDILVVHDPDLLLGAIVIRLTRRLPVVFDVHEDIPASAHTRTWVPRPVRLPMAWVLRRVLLLAERVLWVTLAESGYQHLFATTHPTFPNFPDTSDYPEPGGALDGPIVYLGDVTFERGADVAVAACSSLDVPLRLIGRISPETKARLGLDETSGIKVRIDGLVPNPLALAHLSESSVGLAPLRDLPNYRHSQPTKILEYLAMGLPVVASDLPGTRDLVAGLEAVFLVKPGSVEELKAGISDARSPDIAERAKSQAPDIRSRFRWPSEEVVAFYRSLL